MYAVGRMQLTSSVSADFVTPFTWLALDLPDPFTQPDQGTPEEMQWRKYQTNVLLATRNNPVARALGPFLHHHYSTTRLSV